MNDVALDQVQGVLDAAVKQAEKIGVKMNIAIFDAGANIKAFLRMDGALLGSADVAMRKARTASLFQLDSGILGTVSQPGGPVWSIEHSNGGLITFAGGVVLKDKKGAFLGAIGVSGGSADQDNDVAKAGAAALL